MDEQTADLIADFHDWCRRFDQALDRPNPYLPLLAAMTEIRRLFNQLEPWAVAGARSYRQPWELIGTTLGVTKQTVWERYAKGKDRDQRPSG